MEQEWYLGFRSYEGKNPLVRLLGKPGLGHAFAFAPAGEGGTVLCDPVLFGLHVSVAAAPPAEVATLLRGRGTRVVRLRLPPPTRPFYRRLANWVPSCVTCVKALTGLPSSALTVPGLYKAALAAGGEGI